MENHIMFSLCLRCICTWLLVSFPVMGKHRLKVVGTVRLWHWGSGVTSLRGNVVFCTRCLHWNWFMMVIICHVDEKWSFAKALGCEVMVGWRNPCPSILLYSAFFVSLSTASFVTVVDFSGTRVRTSVLRLQSRQRVFHMCRRLREGDTGFMMLQHLGL